MTGNWFFSPDHEQLCRVIETQTLWGETLYRVWLPNHGTVVRVRADRLKPLQDVRYQFVRWYHLHCRSRTRRRCADA